MPLDKAHMVVNYGLGNLNYYFVERQWEPATNVTNIVVLNGQEIISTGLLICFVEFLNPWENGGMRDFIFSDYILHFSY